MTDWAKFTVVELKEELRSRGIPTAGRKAELVARLSEDDERANGEHAPDDEPDEDGQAANKASPLSPEPRNATADDAASDATLRPEDDAINTSDTEGAASPELNLVTSQPQDQEKEEKKAESESPTDAPVALLESKESEGNQISRSKEEDVPTPDEIMEDAFVAKQASEDATSGQTEATTRATSDSTPDLQKRKRRSLTPPPTDEAMARKRARTEDSVPNGSVVPEVNMVEEDIPRTGAPQDSMDIEKDHDVNEPEQPREAAISDAYIEDAPRGKTKDDGQEMDYERDVAPSVHPATCALYIKNLMRPLRQNEVEAHLVDLATPPGDAVDDSIIEDLYIDQIRTHAFVVLKTTSAASRVRTALHDSVWPNESNRKALWVDFVPPEKVRDWIEMEGSGGRRSSARWEVVYEDGPDGSIEAHLESGSSTSRPGPPPPGRPSGANADAIPTGPRGNREIVNPPTGPRPVRPGTGPGPRPPPAGRPGPFLRTRARPVVEYQKVTEDLASRRIENMRASYTKDANRDLGREINRYSFENGDTFVDRGKEVFEGIRPPHRERDGRQDRRSGRGLGGSSRRRPRGGPSSFRQRSDRYLPGLEKDGDDRRDRSRQGSGRKD